VRLEDLKIPFEANEIEWRQQSQGISGNGKPWCMVLAYVSNRAIMNRLDSVCGLGGWQNEYQTGANGGVICGISVKVGDEWVTKYDGADNTQVEAVKGGLSGAMKRAGVQWGIGRYLYYLDATFAITQIEKPQNMDGWNSGYDKKTNTKYFWQTPTLPNFALPITNEARKQIKELIEVKEVIAEDFFKYFKVTDLEQLNREQSIKAIDLLQKK